MLVPKLVRAAAEVHKSAVATLKAKQSFWVEQAAVVDALQRRLAGAKSTVPKGEAYVAVILAADREIESLERWL